MKIGAVQTGFVIKKMQEIPLWGKWWQPDDFLSEIIETNCQRKQGLLSDEVSSPAIYSSHSCYSQTRTRQPQFVWRK